MTKRQTYGATKMIARINPLVYRARMARKQNRIVRQHSFRAMSPSFWNRSYSLCYLPWPWRGLLWQGIRKHRLERMDREQMVLVGMICGSNHWHVRSTGYLELAYLGQNHRLFQSLCAFYQSSGRWAVCRKLLYSGRLGSRPGVSVLDGMWV